MHYLTEFATSLIVFSLVATTLEMLIPNSNFKKYVQFVIGLILIVLIFSPISKLLKTDFSDDVLKNISNFETASLDTIASEVETQKNEIFEANKEYILSEFSTALMQTANEELVQKFNYSIVELQVELIDENSEVDYENIKEINVRITTNESSESVLPVKKVRIGEEVKEVTKQETRDLREVQKFLIKTWELEESDIAVNISL